MIRVHVASLSDIGRKGLEALVRASDSLELAGTSVGSVSLARDADDTQPDVIVVQTHGHYEELAMELAEVSEGGAALRALAVVVLADGPQVGTFAKAFRAGVSALLPLDATETEIVAAIEAAAAGLLVLHPSFLEFLPEIQPAPGPGSASPKPALTAREIEVLNLMAQGLGNKQIAAQLDISEHTVKFHIASIFNKLDANSRTEAVTLGIRAGLIML